MQQVRDQIGAQVFTVHRLDRPTSGALLFARSSAAARALAAQFEGGEVVKKYLAVVRGAPSWSEMTLDYPLREELDLKSDFMARTGKPAQAAVTEVERLAMCELPFAVDRYPTARYALLRATPHTGRKHQIRRHLRHLGHPIIGDVNHGVGKHNRFFAEHFGARRLLLACVELSFKHPRTGMMVAVRAPLASEFATVLREIGWGDYVES